MMNTQIEKGVVEPCGYSSLANAVEARLLGQVPSWTGVAWCLGSGQLVHEIDGRCLAILRSCKVGRVFGCHSARAAA